MIRIATVVVFFLSVLSGPWWLMAALAVVLLAEWSDWLAVMIGAAMMDLLFGTPVFFGAALPFLYVGTFSVLILAEAYLRSHVLG